MSDKKKTSVYLHPDIHKRVKDEAYKRFGSKKHYSDWVADAIKAALANPDSLDPTKPPTKGNKILQELKKAQSASLKEQETVIGEIVERLERLELKFDSMMDKFEVEQPAKDKSGRRIFDD